MDITIPQVRQSNQLDLFRLFYGTQKNECSNLFTEWDFYPVYCVSRKEQSRLKKLNDNQLEVLKHGFVLRGVPHTIEIIPARLETNNGREDFFPSEREEFIEHALRKLFIIQQNSIHDPFKETWIMFTLKRLQRELTDMGHGMSIGHMKESLNIMRGTQIIITKERKKTFDSNIFSTRLLTNRQEYLANGKSECALQFNSLITHSIDKLAFRQMNYVLFMNCKHRVTRWIFKELVYNFKNAGIDAPPFKISASDLIVNCRLTYSRKRNAWAAILHGINELKEMKSNNNESAIIQIDTNSDDFILKGVTEERQKLGAKTNDIIFHIRPSRYFINFVKASNARMK